MPIILDFNNNSVILSVHLMKSKFNDEPHIVNLIEKNKFFPVILSLSKIGNDEKSFKTNIISFMKAKYPDIDSKGISWFLLDR